MKLGIATRLFLAFAGIAALSLASGGVGWWILHDVETAQKTIVERAMPAVSDARLAAEIAGRIVARSPRLTNAATETVRETEAAALFELAERLRRALERNVEYGHSETEIETLRVTAERLRENLGAQNALVAARIDATGRLTASVAHSLEAAQGAVRPVRDPGLERGRRHHRGDLQSLRAGGVPGPHRGESGRSRPAV